MSLKGKKIKKHLKGLFKSTAFFKRNVTIYIYHFVPNVVAHVRKADVISKHSKKHYLAVRSFSFQNINEETSNKRILLKLELVTKVR